MFRDFSVRSGEFVVLCGVERGNVETDASAPGRARGIVGVVLWEKE